MIEKQLCFVIPNPDDFPSGGNIYNANLIKELHYKKVKIDLVFEMDQVSTSKDEVIYFIDSLFAEKKITASWPKKSCLIVHHLTSMELSGEEKTRVQKIEKERFGKFNAFLCTSDFSTAYLKNNLTLTQPIITIPPALSLSKGKNISRSEQAQKVLIVANIIERKGILAFLQEWAKFSWPSPFSVEIIGSPTLEPEYAKKCQHFVSQLSLAQQNKIIFAGAKSQDEVFQKYQEANLLISTSKLETFGMAIQEAIAFGLPVFVVEGGYAGKHVQQGHLGKAFQTIAELVESLKEWSESAVIRKTMLSKANANLSTYTWEVAARDFLQQVQNKFPHV